eukprot:g24559.t1
MRREGDYLEDQEGQAVKILKITCLSWQGAYAPLTLHGELIVDGWRCSCFAPRWAFSHDWCQAAFAPLRVAHTAAQQIQLSQEGKDDLGYSGRLLGSFWPRHLRVGLKGNPPFLNEEVFSLVETDSSFWMIEDGELHIQLQKVHKAQTWHSALKGHGQLDMFSEQEINKKLMLERFQD